MFKGDAFGNKEAEKVAKKIIEVYSVPIQVQAPAKIKTENLKRF